MDKFDRELQRHLLTVCISSYPKNATLKDYDGKILKIEDDKLFANMVYLHQHGLIQIEPNINNDPFELLPKIKATAAGVDFMLNDGGLSAILKVHTIKFHRDAVVVLEDLITISNMSDVEKDKAKSTLGEMPTEALKAVVQTITTAGLTALL